MKASAAGEHYQQKRAAIDVVSGAVSGAISRVVVGPLDVLKIRFQVQIEPIARARGATVSKYTGIAQAFRLILKEEGIKGLWRGTLPGILLTVPYTGVQFLALQQFRDWSRRQGYPSSKRSVSFVSGAFAGAVATVASYPFDLLRTTLAAQGEPKVYHGVLGAARGIVRQQGPQGLYTGLGVTLLEIMPYAALQFGLYDTFTATYSARRQAAWHARGGAQGADPRGEELGRFMCGLAAGTLAKLGTHPLDVAKKRYQVAGLQRSLAYGARVPATVIRSLPDCLAQIYRTEGLRGLYKGSTLSIVKAAPAAAVTLAVYEYVSGYLLALAAVDRDRKL